MIVVQLLAFLVLLYGVAGLVIKILKLTKTDNRGNTIPNPLALPFWKPAIAAGGILWLITLFIIKIGAQDVGVLVTPMGVSDEEQHTGWHVIAPWNNVFIMDKTVWVYTCANATTEGQKPNSDAIWAPTKEGIKMGFDVSVAWRIIPTEASWIYANVSENEGPNGRYLWLEENIIRTKLKSTLTNIVSRYSTSDAYSTKKEEIQSKIQAALSKECTAYRISIDQVDLREIFYDPAYETKIKETKIAEQEIMRLEKVTRQKDELLKQSTIEKDIAIQRAQGEAEALKIKGEAINQNPKIVELEWINKWDGAQPQYMLGNGQGIMLNMPNQK